MSVRPAPLVLPPLAELADREGLAVRGRGAGPCPVCGAERRGHGDRRPPLAFAAGERWRCHAGGCDAGGDAVALLAALRFRAVPGKGDPRWAQLFAELRGDATSPRPTARPARPGNEAPNANENPGIDPALRAREAAELWRACIPLDELRHGDHARAWIELGRGLRADLLDALDLARALPGALPLPGWVPTRGIDPAAWRAAYRLAVPVYDARGELRALRFRAVDAVRVLAGDGAGLTWGPPPGWREVTREGRDGEARRVLVADRRHGGEPVELVKSLSPRGPAAGLVLADPWGLALLRGAREVDEVPWDGQVVICEGEPDLWTWATTQRAPRLASGAAATWATFGIEAGAWTSEVAARVPDGARVVIRVHHDDAGDRYAEAIRATLAGRCTVLRERPPATEGAADNA